MQLGTPRGWGYIQKKRWIDGNIPLDEVGCGRGVLETSSGLVSAGIRLVHFRRSNGEGRLNQATGAHGAFGFLNVKIKL